MANSDKLRPELAGFNAFYHAEIAPWLAAQAKRQSRARLRAFLWGAGGVLGAPVLYQLLEAIGVNDSSAVFIVYVAVITGLAFWGLIGLQKEVKSFLIGKVCEYFSFSYRRKPSGSLLAQYKSCGILPRYDQAGVEDLISGSYDTVEFDFFECKLFREARIRGKSSNKEKVFHAVLFTFHIPKRFEAVTLALKDRNFIMQLFQSLGVEGSRVALEDPRFEQLFTVWSSDQIEARYLLTPVFMERITSLATLLGELHRDSIEFCFSEGKLLLAVHVEQDQFEAGTLLDDVTDTDRTLKLVYEIGRIFDIIDALNLQSKSRV